ncbi:putative uncharacterized protein C3orf49 homolog [Sphaerodactylus townsendi]|uniref:putative uncharacterized protein C3orf49 homolog n=1 Tax=Sphaerodactylus townsendi TaxID=933632 RepID=UPI0020262847|nr:putative uncharacterized protein C3orf49 homolog [Sphaerodactylus townsendi]
MHRKQEDLSGPLSGNRGRTLSDNPQPALKKVVQVKGKDIERWQGVTPTNLANQNTLIPHGQSLIGSECLEHRTAKKKSFLKQLRTTMKKMLPFYQKASKKTKQQGSQSAKLAKSATSAVSRKHRLLPRIVTGLSPPKIFPKLKRRKLSPNGTIHLDVNIVEEHAQSISRTNTVMQARRMTRRISVVSLPSGIRKVSDLPKKKTFPVFKKKEKSMSPMWYLSDITVGNLQMEVDNLLDNISEKSIQLLALRSAELQQCESLGNKILQSSKQFQRVSLRTTKKHKLKNMCFPCRCCC